MEITLSYFVLLLAGGFFPSENVSKMTLITILWSNAEITSVSYSKSGEHLISSGSDQQPLKNPHQNHHLFDPWEPQMPRTKMFPQLSTYKLLTIRKVVLLQLKKTPKHKKTTNPKQPTNKRKAIFLKAWKSKAWSNLDLQKCCFCTICCH